MRLAGLHVERAVLLFHALDSFLIADLQSIAFARLIPEFQQFLLGSIAKMDLADDRQFHRRRHHELAPRILEYGAAESFLFNGLVGESQFFGGQRSRESRGPRADDQYIERTGALQAGLGDRFQRLVTLRERILDEPHATQFSGDENARHIGFEIRFENWDIQAAPLGAEHQGDRIERACGLARSMADAFGRADQHRLAVDEAEDVVMRGLRTGRDASSAP